MPKPKPLRVEEMAELVKRFNALTDKQQLLVLELCRECLKPGADTAALVGKYEKLIKAAGESRIRHESEVSAEELRDAVERCLDGG